MNPLVNKQLGGIYGLIEELRTRLEQNRTLLERVHERRDLLQKEHWRDQKEISTLNRLAEDYDELEARNEDFQTEREAIRSHLTQIMSFAKSLSNTQEP